MKKLEENSKQLEENGKKPEENKKNKIEKQKLFKKDVVLKSKKFAEYKDVFAAMLEENKCYSMEELKEILKKFK